VSNIVHFPEILRRRLPLETLEEIEYLGTVGDFTVILAQRAAAAESLVHVVVIGATAADAEIIETTASDDLSYSVAELAGNAALSALRMAHDAFHSDPEDVDVSA
jgi:hypothetical protein